MLAPVLYQQGKPHVVEEVELEPPGEGEVLVRMVASGICHSCLSAADGSWKGQPVPVVLGDEGAGVIEAVGPEVKVLEPGDHVILSWAPTCGHCRFCAAGRPALCENKPPQGLMRDGTSRMRTHGQMVYNFAWVSTFGSYSVVPDSCAIPIRKDIPLDKAALIGCSVMTGVGAVLNAAQLPDGASLAVWGAGGIGLNAIQGGNLANASPIIAVDVVDSKLEFARGFGATHGVNASREDPVEAVRRITGRGVDYAIVAVGHAPAVTQAFTALARGGTCVLIGAPPHGSVIELDTRLFAGSERILRHCFYGSARPPIDFPRLINLYLAGRLKLDELITHRYTIEQVDEAFRAMAAGEVARGLLAF
jgi:S-(hydroxymethyl)glutathione dehydrogenase/alcohol dehydrogenase